MESGWGVFFLFATTGLGGVFGAMLAEELEKSIDNSSNKSNNSPIHPQTTRNNNRGGQMNVQLTFKIEIERQFENSIKEVFNKTSENNPLIFGLSLQSAIAYTCKYLKAADFRRTGMSKQETDTIIDDVTKKMLHKYLENY